MPNLKMSKRELRLLGGLIILIVLAAFYYFVYTPQVKLLAEKKVQIEEKQLQLDMLNARLLQRTNYEEQIKSYNNTINTLSPKFYGKLSQEAFIMIINDLVRKSDFNITSYSFSDTSYPLSQYISTVLGAGETELVTQSQETDGAGVDETFFNDIIYAKDATINFVGDYEKLRTFLYNIDNYEKHLEINSINLSSIDGQEVTGQIILSATNLPTLDQDITDFYVGKYFNAASTREIYDNFFAHYPYYIEMQNKVLADNAPSYTPPINTSGNGLAPPAFVPQSSGTEAPNADGTLASGDELVDGKPKSNDDVTVIGSFDQTMHFIPNNPAITGSLAKSADAFKGNSSLKMSYVFDDFTLTNQASLVFEEQSVMNSVFAERIRLGVKYLTNNNNRLKATIVSSDGQTYEVAFDDAPADKRWHYTYAQVPREVKYPFMIRRIYAESVDVQQTMEVELLLDELSIVNVRRNKTQGGNKFELKE